MIPRAPDGSLWYTGQGANKLGRLDPKTGEFKEYPLKTPNSGPHGLVPGQDGHIWFTASSGGYVGELNPMNGEIAEYRPSAGEEIDPHTPVFDHNGIQRRNQLHRAPGSENRQDGAGQIAYSTRRA